MSADIDRALRGIVPRVWLAVAAAAATCAVIFQTPRQPFVPVVAAALAVAVGVVAVASWAATSRRGESSLFGPTPMEPQLFDARWSWRSSGMPCDLWIAGGGYAIAAARVVETTELGRRAEVTCPDVGPPRAFTFLGAIGALCAFSFARIGSG